MQMRSARLPTLSVPGNYYDDLAARTNLHPATIETMREFAILYDADDQGGAYFHFFTAMFGRRMFFELVQRGGGYDGYGTPNTAVRTAAQYRHSSWQASLAEIRGQDAGRIGPLIRGPAASPPSVGQDPHAAAQHEQPAASGGAKPSSA
jgi:hypothetical protein